MANLTFMLWMLLFPVTVALNSYVYEIKLRRGYETPRRVLSGFLDVVTWLAVGYLLYGA
jgi:hypothetical protein